MTAHTTDVTDDRGWRLRHLPVLLGVSGVLMAVAAAVGALVGGVDAALGAAAGVAVVSASYTVSMVAIAWADSVATPLVLPVGLMTYILKVTVLGLVMFAVMVSGWPGMFAMAWAMAAAVVGWTATQIWWVVKRTPLPRKSTPHSGQPPVFEE
jgi:hypothetical protein